MMAAPIAPPMIPPASSPPVYLPWETSLGGLVELDAAAFEGVLADDPVVDRDADPAFVVVGEPAGCWSGDALVEPAGVPVCPKGDDRLVMDEVMVE